MRSMPEVNEYGRWDVLPDDPRPDELNLDDPRVVDGLKRRELLKTNHRAQLKYPAGFWARPPQNPVQAATAEMWRNALLRGTWEGISYINGCLRQWSAQTQVPSTA
ncbi:MAG TPA: hypothetical protein VF444_06130 [Pseudonocardiaceae bacterium]